ncbi:MAG: cyclopropane-fatty-acyl-phospholipid synthase [Cellvibrionaceae bacterium]|jgi:cyclopropane-fatty-acyl-phospholipid synthase
MKVVSIYSNASKANANPDTYTTVDKWAKKLIFRWLESLTQGRLTIIDEGRHYHFGQITSESRIEACIIVKHHSIYRDVLFNGTVGSGEAYMKGSWESPDLVSVIRLMCSNIDRLGKIDQGWSRVNSVFARIIHNLRFNSKKNARLNIAAHYDLGNAFFQQFLDPLMMYSSAIFPNQQSDLEEASVYKLDHICRRLQLTEDDHLLEIGTGWGSMAIHAAKYYGCHVTTTTISRKQHKYAKAAVAKEGLSDKITVLLDDYRDLKGKFDKLVSIEMIEAVGRRYLSQYFSTCSRLLKENGLMLIQAITIPKRQQNPSSGQADFIQRYIFPGGDLPSLPMIAKYTHEDTNMQIVGIEDITQDYAKTLAAWRKNFFKKLSEIKSQGYDDVFTRMWDFYLSYCEGGFRERTINTLQVLLAKPNCLQLPSVVTK